MIMLDYLGIFKAFNDRDVHYIVVGGIAVNLYGIPRMTYDIDILLEMSEHNIKQFIGLIKEWGFKPRVPVSVDDFANEDKRKDWIHNKNMKAFTFINPEWAISEIDVIIDSPVDYVHAYNNAVVIKVGDITIPVVSIDDLIDMKRKSDRKHDQIDVEYLERVKNEQKG